MVSIFQFFKLSPGGCPFRVISSINNRIFNNAATEPQPSSEISIARQDFCTTVYHNLPVQPTEPTPATSQEASCPLTVNSEVVPGCIICI